MLMDQLGVNESQAKGGAGLIFNMVKEKLGAEDFSKVRENVPGIQSMMNAAPDTAGGAGGGLMDMIGGLLGGGGLGKLGELAKLAGGFQKLGLNAESITKFIPVILKYIESSGGEAVKKILASVLASK